MRYGASLVACMYARQGRKGKKIATKSLKPVCRQGRHKNFTKHLF